MTITRGLFRLVAGIATIVMVYSCADSARENVLDPVNTPVSEMDAPVLDDGAVLIAFRYIVQRATPSTLTIRRVIDTSSDVIATIPVAPNAGDDWAEVTAVFGQGKMLLYVNGALVGEQPTDWPELGAHGQAGVIGNVDGDSAFGGGTGFYLGLMDEFRVYSRMLDAEELSLSVSPGASDVVTTWGRLRRR